MIFFSSPNDILVRKSRRMRMVGEKAHMGDKRDTSGCWWKKLGDRDNLGELGLHRRITS